MSRYLIDYLILGSLDGRPLSIIGNGQKSVSYFSKTIDNITKLRQESINEIITSWSIQERERVTNISIAFLNWLELDE